MFKKIKFFALSIVAAISISFNCFAFEASDLSKFKDVSLKVMSKTDTIQPKRTREITGTQSLERLLGKDTSEYKAKYIFVSDEKLEHSGDAKWYYYYQKSWNGRGRGKLNYDNNPVMQAAEEGDILVVGKNSDSEITFIVIEPDHECVPAVYDFMTTKSDTSYKPSLFARMFGAKGMAAESAIEDLIEYEIEANDIESEPVPPESGWTRFKVDMYKDNGTNKSYIVGVVSNFDDGDSFWMSPFLHLRLVGYDTPEDDQLCKNAKGKEYNCGEPSSEYMKKLVGSRQITCEYIARDKYKRLLVDCFDSKGKDLANEMVLAGHAISLKKKHHAAQDAAKANKRGIWQGEFIKPKEHRDRQKASCERNSEQDFCVKYGYKKKKK